MVRALERSREAVVQALGRGDSYFTIGPAICDARRDGDTIEVACSPALTIVCCSPFERGWAVRADHFGRPEAGSKILERSHDGLVTRARFRPEGEVPYVRIQITDGAAGGRGRTRSEAGTLDVSMGIHPDRRLGEGEM